MASTRRYKTFLFSINWPETFPRLIFLGVPISKTPAASELLFSVSWICFRKLGFQFVYNIVFKYEKDWIPKGVTKWLVIGHVLQAST